MGQVAAMENEIGRSFAQICEYRFKRSQISVDIRDDRYAQANKRDTCATDRRSFRAASSNDGWYAG
jgi:hypothetical protein